MGAMSIDYEQIIQNRYQQFIQTRNEWEVEEMLIRFSGLLVSLFSLINHRRSNLERRFSLKKNLLELDYIALVESIKTRPGIITISSSDYN